LASRVIHAKSTGLKTLVSGATMLSITPKQLNAYVQRIPVFWFQELAIH